MNPTPNPTTVLLRLLAALALYAMAMAAIIAISRPAPAHAQDPNAWIGDTLRKQRKACGTKLHWRAKYHSGRKWRGRDRDDDDDHSERWRCKREVKGIGTEDYSLDDAKRKAEANWLETVRFEFGIRYMDSRHAKGVRFICARSGTGGRTGEKLAKMVPFASTLAGGDVLQQCEVRARPCSAPLEPADRAKD